MAITNTFIRGATIRFSASYLDGNNAYDVLNSTLYLTPIIAGVPGTTLIIPMTLKALGTYEVLWDSASAAVGYYHWHIQGSGTTATGAAEAGFRLVGNRANPSP